MRPNDCRQRKKILPTKNSIKKIRSDRNPSYVDKLFFIKQFDTIPIAKNRVNFNRHEKTRITKQFKKLKRFVTDRVKFQPLTKNQLRELKDKDFNVTGKGIFIARPQNFKTGNPIKGVRIRVNLNGTIVMSKGARVEYTVALSRKQIKQLIIDKPNINNVVIKNVFATNPGLAKLYRAAKPKDRSIQILYSTHRGNQIFKTMGSLINYITDMSDERRQVINALVFTIHKPPSINKGRLKNGKGKKKKRNIR